MTKVLTQIMTERTQKIESYVYQMWVLQIFLGECLIECSFVLNKDTYYASSVKLSKQGL